jgi:hypothetical protein
MSEDFDIHKLFDVAVDRPQQETEQKANGHDKDQTQASDFGKATAEVVKIEEERSKQRTRKKKETAASTPEQLDEIGRLLAEMDKNFWLMRKQSKTRIMSWRPSGHRYRRLLPAYQTKADFELLHANKIVNYNGKPTPITELWFTNPFRVTYDGDIYAPDAPRIVDNRLNLWTGWGCEPRPGDWSLMRRHIYEVLANGDKEVGDYIVKWIAWMFQHPGEPPGVAIVLRGKQGTGMNGGVGFCTTQCCRL